jgi:hypothetical protein
MNKAIFEPSLVLIANENWYNESYKDAFLDLFLTHLELLDKYDLTKIYWTDALNAILFESPNEHPWYQSDLSTPLILTIHQKFYHLLELIDTFETVCNATPPLKINYQKEDAQEEFLKMVHTLTDFEEPTFICVGLENQLKKEQFYSFSCDCHDTFYTPTLLNQPKNWLQYVDIVDKFYPKNIEEFKEKMALAFDFIKLRDYNDADLQFDFEFTKIFKKSILNERTHCKAILEKMTKKLVLTVAEARQDAQLRDEYINQTGEYRFRVTQRPTSTRIHYIFEDDKITFLQFYGEGEHDEGL